MKIWHLYRLKSLNRQLAVQLVLCEALHKAEFEYHSSYYTDKLHHALCRRTEIALAVDYHRSKL